MPDYFSEGFMAHAPGWHKLGHVLDEWPGREKAMELAGHHFTVVEKDFYLPGGKPMAADLEHMGPVGKILKKAGRIMVSEDGVFRLEKVDGYKVLVKDMPNEKRPTWLDDDDTWEPTHGKVLHVANESYGVVQNTTGWDLIDALVGEGIKYETGLSLKDGAVCAILAYLDEPYTVPGDDTVVLPFVNVAWSHDGSGAIKCRPTSIRVVCWNTQNAAEAQGVKNQNEYTFRHSSKVMDRIEEAKATMQGIRASHEAFKELAEELAPIKVTKEQRKLFVAEFIPMPEEATISNRVKTNIEEARQLVESVFESPSIADSHRFTAYGLWCAGTEYLDHLRPYRNRSTLFGRQLLRDEPMKAKLHGLIREVVKA